LRDQVNGQANGSSSVYAEDNDTQFSIEIRSSDDDFSPPQRRSTTPPPPRTPSNRRGKGKNPRYD
ncbi:hypothetical protein PTT_10264, partial [Pyrenophora teres f. teres 0-1]